MTILNILQQLGVTFNSFHFSSSSYTSILYSCSSLLTIQVMKHKTLVHYLSYFLYIHYLNMTVELF